MTLNIRKYSNGFRLTALFLLVCVWMPASASEPTAIIEDITSDNAKFQPLDYLFEGNVLEIKQGEKITISYLSSCAIEAISGGTAKVTIGTEKSKVAGKGRVKRKFVECGGSDISLTGRQADAAAGVVVRGGAAGTVVRGNKGSAAYTPVVTVYSLYPVIKLSAAADRITVEGVKNDQKFEIRSNGMIIDLKEHSAKLSPGGVYRARSGNKSVVFKVANTARASSRNLISRLVEL